MKTKFIQVNCREEINTKKWTGPDYRQAEAVLKYRPDIIIFESANDNKAPDTVYNKYNCKNKPIKLIHEHQKNLKENIKNFGDAESNIARWNSIMQLWKENHNVLLYNTDSPAELRREFFEVWKYMYPCALKNWLWWVRIYLREKCMAKNIQWILQQHKNKEKITIAVFLQSFHWQHVKFLLKNPTKEQIWKYYFGKFKEINRDNIGEKIKKQNKVFYKYWRKLSGFN